MRLITWLFASAEALYYLIGFFIGVGGLLMFAGHAIHHWQMTNRPVVRPLSMDNRGINVHMENLNVTLEISKKEAAELLARRSALELPSAEGDPTPHYK